MKNCIKQELMYILKRRFIQVVTATLLLLILMSLCNGYYYADVSCRDFMENKNDCISANVDWKTMVQEEYEMNEEISSSGELIWTDNPIAYSADVAREAFYSITPDFSLTLILESIMAGGFVIIMLVAVVIATYDNKNYTIRVKATQHSRKQIFVAKQVVMFFVIGVSSFVAIVTAYVGNMIYYANYIKDNTILEDIGHGEFPEKYPILVKILVFMALTVFVAEIGFAIGIIIKNSVASLIVVIMLNMFGGYLPELLRYTNSAIRIIKDTFEYYGEAVTTGTTTIDSTQKAVILAIVQVITVMIASFVVFDKRSAYK